MLGFEAGFGCLISLKSDLFSFLFNNVIFLYVGISFPIRRFLIQCAGCTDSLNMIHYFTNRWFFQTVGRFWTYRCKFICLMNQKRHKLPLFGHIFCLSPTSVFVSCVVLEYVVLHIYCLFVVHWYCGLMKT